MLTEEPQSEPERSTRDVVLLPSFRWLPADEMQLLHCAGQMRNLPMEGHVLRDFVGAQELTKHDRMVATASNCEANTQRFGK